MRGAALLRAAGQHLRIAGLKDHVNVFLYDGAIVPDPEGIITGGHDNQTARTVAVHEGETLSATALQRMFEQIIASNRAGGWRRLKRASERVETEHPHPTPG